jgi:hypothetical protein
MPYAGAAAARQLVTQLAPLVAKIFIETACQISKPLGRAQ